MGLVDKSDMQMSFNHTRRRSVKWFLVVIDKTKKVIGAMLS